MVITTAYLIFWAPLFLVTLLNYTSDWKAAKNSVAHEVRQWNNSFFWMAWNELAILKMQIQAFCFPVNSEMWKTWNSWIGILRVTLQPRRGPLQPRLLPILSSRNLPRDVYFAKATFAISIENRNSAEKENLEFLPFARRPVAGTGECVHRSEPPISSTMFALEYWILSVIFRSCVCVLCTLSLPFKTLFSWNWYNISILLLVDKEHNWWPGLYISCDSSTKSIVRPCADFFKPILVPPLLYSSTGLSAHLLRPRLRQSTSLPCPAQGPQTQGVMATHWRSHLEKLTSQNTSWLSVSIVDVSACSSRRWRCSAAPLPRRRRWRRTGAGRIRSNAKSR